MATYTYKEIITALTVVGFEPKKSNSGSHQQFEHKITGFPVTVPAHSNGMVASGTAESILDYAVMVASLTRQNLTSKRKKLSNAVVSYFSKQHKKIRESKTNLIPAKIRAAKGLKSEKDVVKFAVNKMKECQITPPIPTDEKGNDLSM